MKIIEKVRIIIDKYDLQPIILPEGVKNLYEYVKLNPDLKEKFRSTKNDRYFLDKYKEYIPNGWYGFELGGIIIPQWVDIIDEILGLCVDADPKFEINQIKIKFGGIRYYVESKVIEDIRDVSMLIMNKLFDPALIY